MDNREMWVILYYEYQGDDEDFTIDEFIFDSYQEAVDYLKETGYTPTEDSSITLFEKTEIIDGFEVYTIAQPEEVWRRN